MFTVVIFLKLEQLNKIIATAQVSDEETVEFAPTKFMEDADLESFLKRRDVGEYVIPENLARKNTLGQCIVVVKSKY